MTPFLGINRFGRRGTSVCPWSVRVLDCMYLEEMLLTPNIVSGIELVSVSVVFQCGHRVHIRELIFRDVDSIHSSALSSSTRNLPTYFIPHNERSAFRSRCWCQTQSRTNCHVQRSWYSETIHCGHQRWSRSLCHGVCPLLLTRVH
jgi:hypothetical protein